MLELVCRKCEQPFSYDYVTGNRRTLCDACSTHTSRRRRVRTPRARTVAVKKLTRAELEAGAALVGRVALAEHGNTPRPRTRGECRDATRPCPWASCKFHLYLDINPESGSIKINFPDLEPWELQHTCTLDVAERGGITLEEIGEITNLTRERVRQLEVRGLLKLKFAGELAGAK